MNFQIGDVVHTTTGRVYIIRSFSHSSRHGKTARLAPVQPGPRRKETHAAVTALTLIRTAQLSAAFGYAAESEREASPDWMRQRARGFAKYWLAQAEYRNDDSRAALNLGTERILDLEAAS